MGEDITYRKNDLPYQKGEAGPIKSFFSLRFSLRFPHAGDVCHLAHCYPYTYRCRVRRSSSGALCGFPLPIARL